MSQLWMLEDMEPWPDEPAVGAVFTPTTYWASREQMELPAEVCTEVAARVDAVTADGRTEWVAHLGNGFSTMMGDGRLVGDVILHGCLVWDRYLWLDFRSKPRGSLRVLDRAGVLVQQEAWIATRHPGVFSVVPSGPLEYHQRDSVPAGFGIRWKASVVETVASGVEATQSFRSS
ncbi:hypothetical protein CH275_07130 [Rhodococcus sp. 06-235-1A]|uniref:hypothetical protein n=1 Tax=Rhodococcus sp. 06-235-1A TaxID=2022508 RepID=UPI000B9C116C|nr:hypothetical protein [Rhodococcus sp. 06-235-1A]OZD06972.1 hypothetical protein CH275_07130 [Rhodococcus sp. 06-235-1A]